MYVSPAYMKLNAAKTEQDVAILLKQRLESAQCEINVKTQVNEIANEIVAGTPAGYAGLQRLGGLMVESAVAEAFRKDSEMVEEWLKLRASVLERASDASARFRGLNNLNAPASELEPAREKCKTVGAHANRILSASQRYIYTVEDDPSNDSKPAGDETKSETKTEPKSEPAKVKLAVCREPIVPEFCSCANIVACEIGWRTVSKYTNKYPAPESPDYELLEGCKTDDAMRACWGINNGATDYNAALAYACLAGSSRRAIHMMNLGASDLQLGLACGIHANKYNIIRLMLARGAQVNTDIIMFAAKLGTSYLTYIIFPGCGLIKDQAKLEELLSQDATISKSALDYIKSCY